MELGGRAGLEPGHVDRTKHRSNAPQGGSLPDIIKEDPPAEMLEIEIYRGFIQTVEHSNPVTRRLLEEIVAVE